MRPAGSTIRLTLFGLIVLCVSLVAATSWVNHRLDGHRSGQGAASQANNDAAGASIGQSGTAGAPWGDLVTIDIDIEQPMEYVSFEETAKQAASWVFTGKSHAQTRALMLDAGMTAAQSDAALTAASVADTAAATIVKPADALILAMPPAVRTKLYATLAQWPENPLMRAPYHLELDRCEALLLKNGVSQPTIALVKKLAYARGGYGYFSDIELVLRGISSPDGRTALLKALTYQKAVLSRLRLRADTDIDKLLGYWCSVPGVRAKDLRPLLESVKKSPDGGTISLLYLLPPFARERLYTFPLPSRPNDIKMDCHWTALNFFNEVADDRLQDNAYASTFIQEHLYTIGKPSMCGDLVFLVDEQGAVIHSAVHIADDIVFTKNGINYAQPWILMRMKDLMRVYTGAAEPKAVYYRRKEA
jgi:hypothetical protein